LSDSLKRHLDNVIDRTWNFSRKLSTDRDHIMNAVLGLGGEAGEVVDLHKKIFYHSDKKGRLDELKKELGDVMYYWLKIVDLYDFDVDEILAMNYHKLKNRYPECFKGYSVNRT